MKAIIVEHAGGPEVLQIRDLPKPEPRPGWALIRVHAFGLNHAELITRAGGSPDVHFPRVIGIECVGTVEAAPGTSLQPGQRVAAVMGGMGREFDGGYEEYALLPAEHVFPVRTDLPWDVFAAIPETFLTAAGALDALALRSGQALLVHGGSSSVGMAAIALGKNQQLTVLATTRSQQKISKLREVGTDHVIIDSDALADAVRRIITTGVDGVIEMVGVTRLRDALHACAPKGTVCMVGSLNESWELDHFSPQGFIPPTVKLTTYASGVTNTRDTTPVLQQILDDIAAGRYQPHLDRVFPFDQIAAAHRYMESNQSSGKVVVRVDE